MIDDAAPVNDEHADFLVRDGILPDEKIVPVAPVTASKPDWTPADSEEVGDVPAHSIEAAKKLEGTDVAAESPTQPADVTDDITGQPIEAETVADPAMAEESHRLPNMQFDKNDSLPELDEEKEQFSKDPFGGDTVVAEAARTRKISNLIMKRRIKRNRLYNADRSTNGCLIMGQPLVFLADGD